MQNSNWFVDDDVRSFASLYFGVWLGGGDIYHISYSACGKCRPQSHFRPPTPRNTNTHNYRSVCHHQHILLNSAFLLLHRTWVHTLAMHQTSVVESQKFGDLRVNCTAITPAILTAHILVLQQELCWQLASIKLSLDTSLDTQKETWREILSHRHQQTAPLLHIPRLFLLFLKKALSQKYTAKDYNLAVRTLVECWDFVSHSI